MYTQHQITVYAFRYRKFRVMYTQYLCNYMKVYIYCAQIPVISLTTVNSQIV